VTFGIVLATHRRYDEARRQLETALSLGADGPAVWYYLAESTYHLSPDEIDSARKQVERALEFETDNPWAHALAGRIAFEQEQYEKAVAQLREAVRLRPSLLQAHYDLAKAYAILGRKEDAQAETEQVRLIRERYPSGEEDPAIAPNPLLPGQAQ
jgi:Flp pilus assembly protein TadD